MLVLADADLEAAVDGAIRGCFPGAGQVCISIERIYVHESVYDRFLARFAERTRGLKIGASEDYSMEVGSLTTSRQLATVEEHVRDAVAKGARVLTGGAPQDGPGFFYPPTVLVGVDHSMAIMREETFGPVLPVMAVDSLDEAVRLANDSPYGLTASGWTRSEETARRLQRELAAGVVTINDHASSFGEPTAPWGGTRWSGIGRTHGLLGLREMVQPRYVSLDRGRGPELWWYPYDREFAGLMRSAAPALYSTSRWQRIKAQLSLVRFGRLWRRFGPWRLLVNLDKLF